MKTRRFKTPFRMCLEFAEDAIAAATRILPDGFTAELEPFSTTSVYARIEGPDGPLDTQFRFSDHGNDARRPNFIISHRFSGGKFLVDGEWWEENVDLAARRMLDAALGREVDFTHIRSDCRERTRPDYVTTRKGGERRGEDRNQRNARIRDKKKGGTKAGKRRRNAMRWSP